MSYVEDAGLRDTLVTRPDATTGSSNSDDEADEWDGVDDEYADDVECEEEDVTLRGTARCVTRDSMTRAILETKVDKSAEPATLCS